MANVVLVGTQWGDEGKGKIVVDEMEQLRSQGYEKALERLVISDEAHIILPTHRLIDMAREAGLGCRKIGTTGRGIGPAYEDKMSRCGLRFIDLQLGGEHLKERLYAIVEGHNQLLEKIYGQETVSPAAVLAEIEPAAEILRPMVQKTPYMLQEAVDKEQNILFEGAQGTLLDIDHGTFPFVTSSSTVAANACAASGFGMNRISQVSGVIKAYTTRVGEGPFPTELSDEKGDWLREKGGEFGATTGRPRRCGWLDLVALRYAVMINGLDSFAVTKLDVLSGLESISVCEAYEYQGKRLDYFPSSIDMLQGCTPVCRQLPGWQEDITGILAFEELPENARNYILFMEEQLGIPALVVSVGPDREQTIIRGNPFTV